MYFDDMVCQTYSRNFNQSVKDTLVWDDVFAQQFHKEYHSGVENNIKPRFFIVISVSSF